MNSGREPESCLADVITDSSRTGASSSRHAPFSMRCTHTQAAAFMKAREPRVSGSMGMGVGKPWWTRR